MTPERIALFEQYSADNLSQQEKSAVEEQLLADHDFKQEYEAFLQVKDSLIHHNNDRLKKKIASVLDQSEVDGRATNRKRFFYAAASVSLICILSAYFFWPASQTGALYSEFYQTYSETTTVLSEEANGTSLCLNAYNQENYEEALQCLKGLPSTSDRLFYEGMCYANLDHTALAIETLLQVEALNSSFLEESNWYLALLYLKEEKVVDAKQRLKKIVALSSTYKKQSAQKILKALEKE